MDASSWVNGGSPNDCDPVSIGSDKSPSGNDFLQPVFANQPLWKQSGANGQPYIEFTAPTYLTLFNADLFTLDSATIYLVCRRTGPSLGGKLGRIFSTGMLSFITPQAFMQITAIDNLAPFPAGHWHMNFPLTALDSSYGAFDANVTLLTTVKTQIDVETRRDSVTATTNVGVSSLFTNLFHYLGGWRNPGDTIEGEIYEVLVYDGVHTPAEVAITEAYLTSKYAI
jgi:hypothetical protein